MREFISAILLIIAGNAMAAEALYQQHCAMCHDGAVKKAPHRSMIGLLPAEAIVKAMTDGVMQREASALSAEQRTLLATHLAGAPPGSSSEADWPRCAAGMSPFDPDQAAPFTTWGLEPTNSRHIQAEAAAISTVQTASLKPAWAVKFPAANRARSQPLLAGGSVFVGSHDGGVHAFDQSSGCHHWTFNASGEVRTGFSVHRERAALFFGDVLGNVYSIDARTGNLLWRQRADEHPNATITGSPTLHGDTLYVPVSALEVSLAADPAYRCCTFRGSVVAYDAADGGVRWKTYTIDEPARPTYRNRAGTQMMGPSGAVIWNAPAIDAARGQLYVGTGENMSSPATGTSDAIMAMGLEKGEVRWVFQATDNDAWNVACDTEDDHSCPPEDGPDFDFGAAAMLVSTSAGDLVIAGQKSGWVHALDPQTGRAVWQTQVGRGGIQGGIHFGLAADGERVYVPISDMEDGRTYDFPARPGLHALEAATGKTLWSVAAEEGLCGDNPFCHPGISQAVTVAGDVVLAGAMDGYLRAYDKRDGTLLYRLDTTQPFTTTNGETTQGGSFGGAAGPVVLNGRVFVSSGYGIYGHMAGNLLLVLAPQARQ